MPEPLAEARAALALLESLILLLAEKGLIRPEEREELCEAATDSLRGRTPPDETAAALLDRMKVCGDILPRES